MMKIKNVLNFLDNFAPPHYAEDFDNVGLLTGNKENKLTGVLVTLDTLERTIEEAIEKKCNLIVSFHPIIFSGLKKITGENYVEKTIIKAIQHDIAIYAIHTSLDNSFKGVNAKLCEVLGLQNPQILIPQKNTLKKLTTYVPKASSEKIKNALFKAGAGSIGNYTHCSFSHEGKGTFNPLSTANPTVGETGKVHIEDESCIQVIFEKHLQFKILESLFETHPYEEVAYEIFNLENTHQQIGMGMVGELKNPMSEESFLNFVQEKLNAKGLRHSKLLQKSIQKVAVLGGSGSFAIPMAMASQASVFITSDLKYHDYFKAEENIVLVDVGHYESEKFTKALIIDLLTKKFPNFAVILAANNTNPIYYK